MKYSFDGFQVFLNGRITIAISKYIRYKMPVQRSQFFQVAIFKHISVCLI